MRILDKKTVIAFGNWLLNKNKEAYTTIKDITKKRDLVIIAKGIKKEDIPFYLTFYRDKEMVENILDISKVIPKNYYDYKGLISSCDLERIRVALLNVECNIDIEGTENYKLYDRLEKVDKDNIEDFIDNMVTNFQEIKNIIEPYHFDIMLNTLEEIEYFKKSKMSDNNTNYKNEVKQLKKKANDLQKFSSKQIEIKIPILPQESRLQMYTILKRDGLSDKEITTLDNFLRIILGKYRLPKKPKNEIELILNSRTHKRLYKPTMKD